MKFEEKKHESRGHEHDHSDENSDIYTTPKFDENEDASNDGVEITPVMTGKICNLGPWVNRPQRSLAF